MRGLYECMWWGGWPDRACRVSHDVLDVREVHFFVRDCERGPVPLVIAVVRAPPQHQHRWTLTHVSHMLAGMSPLRIVTGLRK